MNQRLSVLAIALLALGAAPLAAQERDSVPARPVVLDDINITSERLPSRASDAAAAVRTVYRAELERRGAPDLVTVLADVPGVQLDPVVGSGAGVALQGLGSDRVLVLLDGAPVAGRIGGEFDLSRVSPAQVQRIEVVEGPQSTLYGSAAIGGVVNLLTRSDTARRVELGTQVGSRNQLDTRARISGPIGGAGASLDIGRRSRDVVPGRSATLAGDVERWDGMARVASRLGAGALDARVLGIVDRQAYGTSAQTAATSFNDNWQLDGLVSTTFDERGATELRLHGSLYDHRFMAAPSAAREEAGEPEWDRQRLLDAELVRRGALGSHRWLVGAKGEREWLESPRIEGGSIAAWSGAVFGSGEWTLSPALRASTGLRLTTGERWGSDLAPRAGLVANLAGGLYAKVAGARGFRAPSFKEQYQNFTNSHGSSSYTVLGNADLVPEQSWNASAEVGRVANGTQLYARGFHNWLTDFIETELVDPATSTFRYQNVGEARTAGIEAGGAITRGIVMARASHAWLHTEDVETGETLLGKAAHTSRGSLTVMPGPASVTGELVYTGEVPLRRSSQGTTTQAGYARLNLSGSVALPGDTRLTAGVDNLLDTEPEGAATFLGRRVFAGLTWGLSW